MPWFDDEITEEEYEDFRKMYKTIKDQVEYVLKNYPSSRNSDELLWWLVIKLFYKDALKELKKWINKEYIPNEVLEKLPKFETVSRVRRKFNEMGLYLPTIPEVLERRRKREKAFRKYFSGGSV